MTDKLSPSYPVLPLRDIVVFPHMIVPLFVGREKSVRALALPILWRAPPCLCPMRFWCG